MSKTIHVYTTQIAQWRKLPTDVYLFDITAKSGKEGKFAAPDFNDVMRYKDGHLSKDQYADIYNRRMIASLKENHKAWAALLAHEKIALACYCKAGEFCHRHLFIPHLQSYLESKGYEMVLHPETPKPFPKEPVISKERPIIPFFGREDYLSNWHYAPFVIKNVEFVHVEQAMMYMKAKLFGDHATAELILAEKDPMLCKRLGREVKPFNDALWKQKCDKFVGICCLAKARAHPHIFAYVLSTDRAILVEASPYDAYWGAKVGKDSPLLHDPTKWPGLNKHGLIWEEVRSILQQEVLF